MSSSCKNEEEHSTCLPAVWAGPRKSSWCYINTHFNAFNEKTQAGWTSVKVNRTRGFRFKGSWCSFALCLKEHFTRYLFNLHADRTMSNISLPTNPKQPCSLLCWTLFGHFQALEQVETWIFSITTSVFEKTLLFCCATPETFMEFWLNCSLKWARASC